MKIMDQRGFAMTANLHLPTGGNEPPSFALSSILISDLGWGVVI